MGACWYVIDDRPPGAVRRQPQGDSCWSAGRRSSGSLSSPRWRDPMAGGCPKTSFRSLGVGLAGSGAMTTLADDLVPDQLWALVAPLLPAPPRPPYGGRHRTISDRTCLAAIVYMARTSTPWRLLPAGELVCGSPATCWRRLTVGQRRRVRPAPPGGLGPPGRAGPAGLEPGERGHHECAGQAWGDHVGANPVDRGKPGSKLHLGCDGGGLP